MNNRTFKLQDSTVICQFSFLVQSCIKCQGFDFFSHINHAIRSKCMCHINNSFKGKFSDDITLLFSQTKSLHLFSWSNKEVIITCEKRGTYKQQQHGEKMVKLKQ